MNSVSNTNFEGDVCKLKDSTLKVRGNDCFRAFILVAVSGLGFNINFAKDGTLDEYQSTYGKIPIKTYVECLFECISEKEYADFYDLAVDIGLKLEEKTSMINTMSLRQYVLKKRVMTDAANNPFYLFSYFETFEDKEITKEYEEYDIKCKTIKYFDEFLFKNIMTIFVGIAFKLSGINKIIEISKKTFKALYPEEENNSMSQAVFKENLKRWILFNDMDRFVKIFEEGEKIYIIVKPL